jgi:SAM-dependent methyltransferase
MITNGKLWLHLGCGTVKLEGYVNVDSQSRLHPDEVVDLTHFPWPWNNESVDHIYSHHVFEHLPDALATMMECHRILKRGGTLEVVVPYALSASFYDSPTHYHPWTDKTVNAFLLGRKEHIFCDEGFELCFSNLLDTGDGLDWKGRLRNLCPRPLRLVLRSVILGMFDQVHFKVVKP